MIRDDIFKKQFDHPTYNTEHVWVIAMETITNKHKINYYQSCSYRNKTV